MTISPIAVTKYKQDLFWDLPGDSVLLVCNRTLVWTAYHRLFYPDSVPTICVFAHIINAWFKWRQVTGVLRGKKVTKGNVYKYIVRPVVLYSSECRPATRANSWGKRGWPSSWGKLKYPYATIHSLLLCVRIHKVWQNYWHSLILEISFNMTFNLNQIIIKQNSKSILYTKILFYCELKVCLF